MQLTISFTCRECDRDAALLLDTSNLGLIGLSDTLDLVELRHDAPDCGHVSGEVRVEYTFRKEDHAPSRERAPSKPGATP